MLLVEILQRRIGTRQNRTQYQHKWRICKVYYCERARLIRRVSNLVFLYIYFSEHEIKKKKKSF